MPTPSDALNARLLGFAALAALVGDRVYPAVASPGVAEPYVVFARIDEDQEEAFSADADIIQTEFEATAVGTTYASAEAVYEQVRAACRRFRGSAGGIEVTDMLLRGGQGPLYNDEVDRYTATQRVAVRYRNPAGGS